MIVRKETKTTWLFIGFLLIAGIVYYCSWGPMTYRSAAFFCINLMIYAGLLLLWLQSIRDRLLPTRSRSYITASALFMLTYLIVRAFKYRVVFNDPVLERYCVYLYYIPMTMIPVLFLMVCLRIKRSENKDGFDERLLTIPSVILSILFLTNDFHQLIYRPNVSLAEFAVNSGTYSYGPVFYLTYAWMGICVLIGIILLISITRVFNYRILLPFILVIAVWVITIAILNLVESSGSIPLPYKAPEIHIFSMLGLFEACIRSRLIPYNENYKSFFRHIKIPVLITDRDMNVIYQTSADLSASDDILRASLEAPIYKDKDTRLSGMEIKGGYAFWTEDESSLNRMNERLKDANDILSMENELIQREQDLAKEKAAIDHRSALYARIAQEVYPTQKKISEILSSAEPGTPLLKDKIAEILVLTSFIKRKANFILLASERDQINSEELSSAMRESVFYLKYLGMHASFTSTSARAWPCQTAADIYDHFRYIIEQLIGNATELWINFNDEALLFMVEQAQEVDTAYLTFPYKQSVEDGQLILKINIGGDES